MYECLGCGKSNKLKSSVVLIPNITKILCEECRSAMELGQYLASNKGVMRIITKFLDKELKEQKVVDSANRFCHNCHFFMTWDNGYSNYTVEETIVHCLKNKNPFFPIEESYSWLQDGFEPNKAEALCVAKRCPGFEYAERHNQMRLDVDGDTKIQEYPELVELARSYFGDKIKHHDGVINA